MSQHLAHLKVGDTMLFKGPKGRYTYEKGSLNAIGVFQTLDSTHPALSSQQGLFALGMLTTAVPHILCCGSYASSSGIYDEYILQA